MSRILTLLAAVLVLPACGRQGAGPATETASPAGLVTDGYADPEACAPCHADIARSYRQVAMSRSFGRPDAADVIEDFERDNRVVHEPSGLAYEMLREGDRFVQRRRETGGGKAGRAYDREISFVIGSGRHARSYLHLAPSGEMTEMPVTWYPQERTWGMSPGYDRSDQPDFFRPVTYTCLFCHTGYPDVPAGTDSMVAPQIFPRNLPAGIDCQRCHGPGMSHVRLAGSRTSSFADVRGSIVNPKRLSPARQMDICMQCHLETTSAANWSGLVAFGRGVFSFRPGDDLAEYRRHFDHPRGAGHDDKFEIAHQAYRLRQSACFRASAGRMTCTTCHDPHRRPADAAAHFAGKCLGCHAPSECGPALSLSARGEPADCVPCHMPQRRTDDVVHVTMTDHLIRRTHPPEGERLAPRRETEKGYRGPIVFHRPEEIPSGPERDLILGVASLLDDVDADRGLALLEKGMAAIDPSAPEPHFQLGLTLQARGRLREALAALGRAADLAPRHARVLLALANALEASGNEEQALVRYDQAIAASPGGSEAHTNAGRILARQGRLHEALARFDRALGIRPDDSQALVNRGVVLHRLGQGGEAEAALRESLRIRPGLADACLNLATILLARGDPEGALGLLRNGAARNPSHAGLAARAAWMLSTSPRAGLRDGGDALRFATAAVRLTGRRDARALDALAAALAEAGRPAEAVPVASEARARAAAAGQSDLAAAIEARRRQYQAGRPYREGDGSMVPGR